MQDFFLPIKGYEGLYAVSDLGRVKSLDRVTSHGRSRVSQDITAGDSGGYLVVDLCSSGKRSTRRVHRLVAEAFLPKPEGCDDVHHKNHDKKDNRSSNLKWVTKQENMEAASEAGRLDGKSRGYGVKLSQNEVSDILQRLKEGETPQQIAPLFSVSDRTIRHIRAKQTWNGPGASL